MSNVFTVVVTSYIAHICVYIFHISISNVWHIWHIYQLHGHVCFYHLFNNNMKYILQLVVLGMLAKILGVYALLAC